MHFCIKISYENYKWLKAIYFIRPCEKTKTATNLTFVFCWGCWKCLNWMMAKRNSRLQCIHFRCQKFETLYWQTVTSLKLWFNYELLVGWDVLASKQHFKGGTKLKPFSTGLKSECCLASTKDKKQYALLICHHMLGWDFW